MNFNFSQFLQCKQINKQKISELVNLAKKPTIENRMSFYSSSIGGKKRKRSPYSFGACQECKRKKVKVS